MGSSRQLRYWGMTLHTGYPTKLVPIIDIVDEDVVTDSRGNYTIVIGRKEDKPSNADPQHGMTWAEWSLASVLCPPLRIPGNMTPREFPGKTGATVTRGNMIPR